MKTTKKETEKLALAWKAMHVACEDLALVAWQARVDILGMMTGREADMIEKSVVITNLSSALEDAKHASRALYAAQQAMNKLCAKGNAKKTNLMNPQRIQLSRKKGFTLPPDTVVVSRPSRWGNPFKDEDLYGATKARRHAHAVEHFARMVREKKDYQLDAQRELRGKNLACWCKPGTPCHADVLLEVANK